MESFSSVIQQDAYIDCGDTETIKQVVKLLKGIKPTIAQKQSRVQRGDKYLVIINQRYSTYPAIVTNSRSNILHIKNIDLNN